MSVYSADSCLGQLPWNKRNVNNLLVIIIAGRIMAPYYSLCNSLSKCAKKGLAFQICIDA